MPPQGTSEQLNQYVKLYLASPSSSDELEVRFGTKHWNPITQIDFDNVVAKLKSLDFKAVEEGGAYHMNIRGEYTTSGGDTRLSAVRTTIKGLRNIQAYCRTDSFDTNSPPPYVSFTAKKPKDGPKGRLRPLDFHDFQFRVNYKEENPLRPTFKIVRDMLSGWKDSKKVFRLLKRFTFVHPDYPLKVDCSMVRSSKARGGHLIPEFRVKESGLFGNLVTYEIEIELDSATTPPAPSGDVTQSLRRAIKTVLSALQGTNYPVSYAEQENALRDYLGITRGPGKHDARRLRSRDFVGPSSVSLELPNVAPLDKDSRSPNIRLPYTVTDKADGIRKLLMIPRGGRVYLIDVNMKVQFTGMVCETKKLHGTIIDGEHVLHDKYGKFINHYLAFDIYYLGMKDLRALPFCEVPSEEPEEKKGVYRLPQLSAALSEAVFKGVVGHSPPLHVQTKTFYVSSGPEVFSNCAAILRKKDDGLFTYETDGLIFTPADKAVGSATVGRAPPPTKKTWAWSLKWKPPEFNTIDFLVTTKRKEDGEEFVGNVFQDGQNLQIGTQLTQYKTLVLRVGFDERRHGFLDPCRDVIEDKVPTSSGEDGSYKPVPFYPSDPTPDYPGYLANVALERSGDGQHMLIEDRTESFGDRTIVEFRFDATAKPFWQWIPIRVRKLKTAEFRSGKRNYGNAYHVAQSVWRSIHNPVTSAMISTGRGIPTDLAGADIYYNRRGRETKTRALRNFHNLFVKRRLILAVSRRGGNLIDMTVGKAGDFPKWMAAGLAFVFGLDISKDNIRNRLDGACARYLNFRRRYKSIPSALFVAANSALNIRSGQAASGETGRKIIRAVFGEGVNSEASLGKGVARQFGVGKDGFDVVSNQFSIHYFFKNRQTLAGFLRNVAECCRVGGYFIGTSYDGRTVFRQLESKAVGEGISIVQGGQKIWGVTKQYTADDFKNDASCLGYRIDVYQESINKVFPEYLVNYDYLVRLMEDYGFVLPTAAEAKALGLPGPLGTFQGLYNDLEDDVAASRVRISDVGSALAMTPDEKRISFLNRYFVFKKVRDVDAAAVERALTGLPEGVVDDDEAASAGLSGVAAAVEGQRPRIRKLGRKISLRPKAAPPAVKVVRRRGKVRVKT